MKKPVKEKYISNPFVLAYEAAKRLFNTNRGWAILFIVLGVLSVFSYTDDGQQQPANQSTAAMNQPEIAISVALVVFVVSAVLLFIILIMILASYLTGLFSYVALESEKGRKVTLKEASLATREKFWDLLGSLLLAAVKIFGWTLLFVIPGIIAALRYALIGYVVMDTATKHRGVKVIHERTKTVTKGRLWEVLGITFTGALPFVGTLLNTAGGAALYNQLKIYTDKKLKKPKIHWLNYLPGALLAAAVLGAVAGVVYTLQK